MPTKLILIRHGRTEWNAQKKYCGISDVGLNAQGIREVKKLQQRLKEERISCIYASDRKRAIETCRILFKHRPVKRFADLRELHFGVFEGLTYGEVLQRYPEIYKRWLKDPFRVSIPGGETLLNFQKRVKNIFKEIITLNRNKTIAVVCHGGTISIFINSIVKSRNFWKFIPRPASITIIEYGKNYFYFRRGKKR